MDKIIRLAEERDSQGILEIYAPFVKNTAISFEYEIPSSLEFKNRINSTLKNLPWLVYEIGNQIVGYAYASEHRKRSAYQWSVDLSIYVKPEFHRKGIAKALYGCLIDLLKAQGFYNAFAAITIPNIKSEGFHEALGFMPIGVYHNVGYKLERWHSTKWFELTIREHASSPKPARSIKEIIASSEFNNILNVWNNQI